MGHVRWVGTLGVVAGVVACGPKKPVNTAPPAEEVPTEQVEAPEEPEEVGFTEVGLVGMDTSEGLRTVRITREGLAPAGAGILRPREGALWHLDVERTRRLAIEIDQLVAWPDGQVRARPAPLSPQLREAGAYQRSKLTLTFVGPDKVGMRDAGTGFYGGTHPIHWDRYQVEAWPGEAKAGSERSPIDGLVGEAARASLMAAGPSHPCYTAGPEAWTVLRAKGQWVVQGSTVPAGPACVPKLDPFQIEAGVPEQLVGSSTAEVFWGDWTTGRAELQDVVVGPSGQALAVYRNQIVLEVGGEAVASLPWRSARVVSVAWSSTPSEAEAWRGETEP